jgi:hypothetical protein
LVITTAVTTTLLVCAIDPGLSRLAVAAAWISCNQGHVKIDAWKCCMTLNLMRMADECKASMKTTNAVCPHGHTREIVDGFNHVLLIERQPPQGHVTIQNLFLQRFGSTKVQLVDATRRNTHFGWQRGKTTRWERKRMATHLVQTRWYADLAHGVYDRKIIADPTPTDWEREEMARLAAAVATTTNPISEDCDAVAREMFVFEVHDRADAVLLIVFWLQEHARGVLVSPPTPAKRVMVSKYFATPHPKTIICRSSVEFLRDKTTTTDTVSVTKAPPPNEWAV